MPIKDPQKNREYKRQWIAKKRKEEKNVEPNNFVEPKKITDHELAEWKKFSQNIDNSIFYQGYFLKIDKKGWNICNKCESRLFPWNWDAKPSERKKFLANHKHKKIICQKVKKTKTKSKKS